MKVHVESQSSDSTEYPPRIRLDVSFSIPPKSSLMCNVLVKGVDGINSFTLRVDCEGTSNFPIKPRQDYGLLCNSYHHASLLSQLSKHATKRRDIGSCLGFHQGELNKITSIPLYQSQAPKSWLSEMIAEWLEWAPGDKRGSKHYATLNSLKDAVRDAGLGRTAKDLTLTSTQTRS